MTSNPGQPQPRKAADFDEILDGLAGIEPREDLQVSEEEDGRDTPLSADLIELTVATVAKMQARARAARPWWLQPAAVLPIVFVLLSAVPAYFIWDPRNSKTLSYEDAHDVAFDHNYSAQSRNVAVGKVVNTMLRGITAIRVAARRDPGLADDAETVCTGIQNMVDAPSLSSDGTRRASGSMQDIVDSIKAGASTADQRRSFGRFLDGCKSGFQVVHRATSEPGLVGEQARLMILLYARWVRQELPEDPEDRGTR
jgi:hypothetical protein